MKISEICDFLEKELLNTGYEYGFYLDGAKHRPDMSNGYDEAFADALLNDYRIQDTADTMREKVGTCIDITLLMKAMLAERGISGKIWLLHYPQKNKFHTILTFEAEGRLVYLELMPQSRKPWYGKEILYESENELISEYARDGCDMSDITDLVAAGSRPEFVTGAKQ